MSRTFVVDGTQGFIANVSTDVESKPAVLDTASNLSFSDHSYNGIGSSQQFDNVGVLENNVTNPTLDFNNFFTEFFDDEQAPVPPPKDYPLFVAGPVYPDQSFNQSLILTAKQEPLDQYEYNPYEQEDIKPVVRKGRGRPIGSKTVKTKVKVVKEKRKKVFDKTVFTYPQIITMALMNSKDEIATVQMFYAFAQHHFPDISTSSSWQNTLRHALTDQRSFERVQDVTNSAGKANFWTFLANRKEELIEQINKTINDNEYTMEKLRMKDIDALPSILSGNCPLPEEIMPFVMPVKQEIRQEVLQQVTNVGYNLPQQYLAPQYPMDVPTYSNQYVPAHQQVQWNHFGMAQQGYNMQANHYQNINNENNPYAQHVYQQYQYDQNIQHNTNYY